MKRIFNHIRQQRDEVKRHILHVTIVVCGILLALLWIYSLGLALTNSDNQARMNNDLKIVSTIKENITSGYDVSQNNLNLDNSSN